MGYGAATGPAARAAIRQRRLARLAVLGGVAGMLFATIAIMILYRRYPDRDAPASLESLFGGALLLSFIGVLYRPRPRPDAS